MDEMPHLRADAEARRVRLLQTASRLFAQEGLDVPMERIAREAGVGVGTLYRRFPDRTTLLVAVASDGLRRIRDGLRVALAAEGATWRTFTVELRQPERLDIRVRGRVAQDPEAAAAVNADPEICRLQQQVAEAMDAVVRAAQAEGSVRTDIGSGDVALLLSSISRRALPSGAPATAGDRLHALVLDALSAGPRENLPGEAIDVRDVWSPP